MRGAGGYANIFDRVKKSCKQIVRELGPGDTVTVIAFDSSVKVQPTVTIHGDTEVSRIDGLIDDLRAEGAWTFTAKALRNALEEAARLEKTFPMHNQAVVILTDGLNDPPPGDPEKGLSLESVAKPYAGRTLVWLSGPAGAESGHKPLRSPEEFPTRDDHSRSEGAPAERAAREGKAETEGCPGNPQQLNISIEDNPGALVITGPAEVCEFETDVVFTVPLFANLTYAKKEYAFYCLDLLDLMEADFLDYLFTFLHVEGLPALADTIKKGAADCKSYDIVQDMKRVFNDKTYKKLIEHSFYYAPPYLPLYAFTEKPRRTPLTCFTVMEWEQPDTRDEFAAFFKKHFPGEQSEDAIREIQKKVDKN